MVVPPNTFTTLNNLPPSERQVSGLLNLSDEQIRPLLNDVTVQQALLGLLDNTAAPADPTPPRGFGQTVSDLFSNKRGLGNVAAGIALLEGTPLEDAFKLREDIQGTGAAVGGDFFTFTNKNNPADVITLSDKDRRFSAYANNPNYVARGFGETDEVSKIRSEERIKTDFKSLEELRSAMADNRTVTQAYEDLKKIIFSPDFKSGPIEAKTFGLRRFLGDKETIETQELFETYVSLIVPRLRPPGSGSTSDLEVALYANATASLGKNINTNKEIVLSALANQNLQKERLAYIDSALDDGVSFTAADEAFADALEVDEELQQAVFGKDTILVDDFSEFDPEEGKIYFVTDQDSQSFGQYFF